MRVLFFILVLALPAFAQTPFVKRTYEAGNTAARELRYESAIEKYRTTLLRAETERLSDEFLARIHFNIGVCFYHLKRADEAVTEYKETIKLSQRDYQKAFYALGMAQTDLKNWRKAADAFREALKIKQADGEAWFDLGIVYLEDKDYAAAQQAFENSIRYESVNSADAHNNLGVIIALKGDFSSAIVKFEKAIYESKGQLEVPKRNLKFCQAYRQNFNKELIAELEFSKNQ